MDPGELHTPHRIARCRRSALQLLPWKTRQGLGMGLPWVQPEGCHWGDAPPTAQRVPVCWVGTTVPAGILLWGAGSCRPEGLPLALVFAQTVGLVC